MSLYKVGISAAIYTERDNPDTGYPEAIDVGEGVAAVVASAFGWGYEFDGVGHLVFVPSSTWKLLEQYGHLAFKVQSQFTEYVIEMEMP